MASRLAGRRSRGRTYVTPITRDLVRTAEPARPFAASPAAALLGVAAVAAAFRCRTCHGHDHAGPSLP